MEEWISVDDALPDLDVTVLAAVNGYHWLAFRDGQFGGIWCGMWENEYWREPTHWMALPDLPEQLEIGKEGEEKP